jgi:spermidine synthase
MNMSKKHGFGFTVQKQTKFNNLTVVRKGNIITLWSGNNKQTEIEADNPLSTRLEYSRHFFLSLAFQSAPTTILILGLGGGAIPSLLHSILEESIIDVVEIDPEMPDIAKKYFNFSISERLRLFINDAFYFIRDNNKNYDIIFMDTYIENKLPRTVNSTEFLSKAARSLAPGGVFVANLMTINNSHFQNTLERMQGIFKSIWLLPGVISTNSLTFATNNNISMLEIQQKAKLLKKRIPFDLKIFELIGHLKQTQHSDL